jgi:hypothetical protein
MSDRFKTFEEFWPYYVLEHSKKSTRVLHFIGTTAAVATLGAALVKGKPALIPLALVAGYGPAWISHFFIEKNRPATFKYPLWSLLADFRMWGKMASGTMDAEVEAAQAKRTEEEVHAPSNGVYAVN